MLDIPIRMRRNRKSKAIRQMVQETKLSPSDLVLPFFIIEGVNQRIPIMSMPGVFRFSIDLIVREAIQAYKHGILAVALFPSIEPSLRSLGAEEAWNALGLLARTIRAVKQEVPELCVIADVALDPFTSHGHDGLATEAGAILNDETIECLIRMSLMQAEAGVDFVAPSDMMDGRVGAIRRALDDAGYANVGILSYSAKYASSLYGPFRDALRTCLSFGDKRTYQMDPANVREALIETSLDEEEGADILMVKPAGFYLDVIAKLRASTNRPIAAYQVSGEYAMIMAAHQNGWLDGNKVLHESLLSIKRAGADLIFTYGTMQVLKFLNRM